ACAHLETALAAFVHAGIPYRAAQTRLLLAQVLGHGDREVAGAEARAALSAFEDLGAGRDADAAAALMRDFGIKAARTGPKHAGQCVHANGIDIYYVEAGQGEPLLLLDNAMVSTNPVWTSMPVAYASFLGTLAEHFRVIAPDMRGSGKSVHPGGPIPAALLADDVAALIDALNLDRPLICGFSDGGETATLVGIRHPGSVRAIVNHGGYDLFNPDPHAPAIAMTRQMLGGSAGATQAD